MKYIECEKVRWGIIPIWFGGIVLILLNLGFAFVMAKIDGCLIQPFRGILTLTLIANMFIIAIALVNWNPELFVRKRYYIKEVRRR